MFTNVLKGLGAAVRNYRMVLLIWAWHLLIAAVAVAPAQTWWRGAFNHAVEATRVNGFNFAVLADLTKYDYVGAFGLLSAAMTGAVLLSILASGFIMGGMLKVISGTGPSMGLMHRFFGGGGFYFWRFTRLMLIGGTSAVAVGAALSIALGAIESPLIENGSEVGLYVWLLFNLTVLAIACGLFLLALDYARVQVVVDDARGMIRAYFHAIWFVVRHAVTVYGMAVIILVLAGILLLAYVAYETVSPAASSWGAIFVLFVIQQVISLTRVGLRVALVDAEFGYATRAAMAASVVATQPGAAPLRSDVPGHVAESTQIGSELENTTGTSETSSAS